MTSVQIEIPDEIASEFYRRAPHPERRVELVERIFRATNWGQTTESWNPVLRRGWWA